jgi:hypothetical protein
MVTSEDIREMVTNDNRIFHLVNSVKARFPNNLTKFQNLTQRALSISFVRSCRNSNTLMMEVIDKLFSQVYDYAHFVFSEGSCTG